ncbi:MAG: hypothetical protein KGJ57_07520 [Sphingomonadales bacterium]|nr:hypothetical protein [Sphingomonadales bacterium]MDE2169261.1 hypothetical protein [Sphingomonadales bacterium]
MRHFVRNTLAAVLILAAVPLPALADAPLAASPAETQQAKFQSDRQNILAMAGNYKVTFDFRETTPWQTGYTPIPSKVTSGHESVRVIEDTGRKIILQHLLVVEQDGKTQVVKHWRQDWTYEPESVLTYAGRGRWTFELVPENLSKGRWSQTVWQTDDSPRYGGWGEWTVEGGVPRWRSNWTWRPLARRDAVRHPPYDRYRAINRHSPTPTGWIHWQDNLKMGLRDGKLAPFVQESVLNTYERAADYNIAAADTYWSKTSAYWAEVRKAWDETIRQHDGVTVAEVADSGSAGAEELMTIADDLAQGRADQVGAVRRARAVITRVTSH